MLQRIRILKREPMAYAVYYIERDGTREVEIMESSAEAQSWADWCVRDECTSIRIKPICGPWSMAFARWQQRRADRARSPLPVRDESVALSWSDRLTQKLRAAKLDDDALAITDRAMMELKRNVENFFDDETLGQCIDELPPLHWAMMQRRVAGLSCEQIAEEMDTDAQSVLQALSEVYSGITAAYVRRMHEAGELETQAEGS